MRFPSIRNVIVVSLLSFVLLIALDKVLLAGNGSVVFTYDALGRISTASYDTGAFVTYTYDANGNRLTQTTNINTATLYWCATSGACPPGNNNWGQTLWAP